MTPGNPLSSITSASSRIHGLRTPLTFYRTASPSASSTNDVTRAGSNLATNDDSQKDGDEDEVRIIVVSAFDSLVPVLFREFQISYVVGEVIGGKVTQGALWIVRDANLQIVSSAILIMDVRSSGKVSIVDISQIAMVQFRNLGDYALFWNAVPQGVGIAAASILEREPWKSGWPILAVLATMLAGQLGYHALRSLVDPGLVPYHERNESNADDGDVDLEKGPVPE